MNKTCPGCSSGIQCVHREKWEAAQSPGQEFQNGARREAKQLWEHSVLLLWNVSLHPIIIEEKNVYKGQEPPEGRPEDSWEK